MDTRASPPVDAAYAPEDGAVPGGRRRYPVLVGRLFVPVLLRVVDPAADAGAGVASLAADSAGGELPIAVAWVALAAPVVAMLSAIVVRLLWWRGIVSTWSSASTDPELAGILAVVFVTGHDVERWVPATVVRLACAGDVRIVDDRPSIHSGTAASSVTLEFSGDPAALLARAEEGECDAAVACALFGSVPERGARTRVTWTPEMRERVAKAGRSSVARLADAYLDRMPPFWLTVLTVGSAVGVVGGLLMAGVGPQTPSAFLVAGLAIVLGLVGFLVRMFFPRGVSLNVAGIRLRENARMARPSIFGPVDSVAEAERRLPWAVLYGTSMMTRRFAKLVEREGRAPFWYQSVAGYSPARFMASVSALEAGLALPPLVATAGATASALLANDLIVYRAMGVSDGGWLSADNGLFGGGFGDGGGGGGGDGGGGGGGDGGGG